MGKWFKEEGGSSPNYDKKKPAQGPYNSRILLRGRVERKQIEGAQSRDGGNVVMGSTAPYVANGINESSGKYRGTVMRLLRVLLGFLG